MGLFEYFYGLLTYQDTVDSIDYVLRTLVWVLLVFSVSIILSALYHLFAVKEEKNKRRIKMRVVVKNDIKKYDGISTGFSWFPPSEIYELEAQCPSSGFCFTISDKNLYENCKVGDFLDVEIVEIYSKIFFNPFEKDFLKFKITDFKKAKNE